MRLNSTPLDSTESEGAAASKVAPTLRVGDVVAEKYRLERLLGSGGMAEVYAAVNERTEKRVALKWIHPALASTDEGLTRFRREALAAGRIDHPNVVTVFDVVEHKGSACLVMELLDGETLARRLARSGPLPIVEAVALILPAMRGVAAAHARGVVHRDLKPDNIFVCQERDGTVRDCKVLDFGVSKLTATDSGTPVDITLTGNLVGTPAYMAPEQVRGSRQIDHRADVWALGVVLYELLAGRPPFVQQLYSAVMVDIATVDAPPLSRFRPDVPRRIEQVVHRALERGVEERFQDVPSFMHALEDAARAELNISLGGPSEGLITQIATPRVAVPQPSGALRGSGARFRLAPLLTVAGLAVAAVALWRFSGSRPASPPSAPVVPVPQQARVPPPPPAEPAQVGPPSAPSGAPLPAVRAEGTGEGPAPKHAHRRSHADDPRAHAARPTAPHPGSSARAGKLSVDDF